MPPQSSNPTPTGIEQLSWWRRWRVSSHRIPEVLPYFNEENIRPITRSSLPVRFSAYLQGLIRIYRTLNIRGAWYLSPIFHTSMLFVAISGLIALLPSVLAVSEWGQCGGTGYSGSTVCDSGLVCTYQNDWYSQCLPGTGSSSSNPNSGTSTGSSTCSGATKFKYFGGESSYVV